MAELPSASDIKRLESLGVGFSAVFVQQVPSLLAERLRSTCCKLVQTAMGLACDLGPCAFNWKYWIRFSAVGSSSFSGWHHNRRKNVGRSLVGQDLNTCDAPAHPLVVYRRIGRVGVWGLWMENPKGFILMKHIFTDFGRFIRFFQTSPTHKLETVKPPLQACAVPKFARMNGLCGISESCPNRFLDFINLMIVPIICLFWRVVHDYVLDYLSVAVFSPDIPTLVPHYSSLVSVFPQVAHGFLDVITFASMIARFLKTSAICS